MKTETPSILILLAGALWNDSRVIKIAQSLSKQYAVTVFCYSGGTPVPVQFRVIETSRKNTILSRFLERTYFWLPYQRNITTFLKTLDKVDLVWANDLNTLYTGAYISKNKGAKLIYDSHEIYVETINQFFPPNTKGLKKAFHSLNCAIMRYLGKRNERKYGSQADHIFVANDSFREVLVSRYKWENTSSLYNLPLYKESELNKNPDRLIDLFPADNTIVLYHGVLNSGRGLELLIESVKYLPENYHLVILGSGFLLNHLKLLVNQKGMSERVTFLPMVPENELIDYIRGANVGINLLEKFNISKWLASTNKLFQYLHAGIPAVCSMSPENMKVLAVVNVGVAVENKPSAIAEGIRYLCENPENYTTEKLSEIAKKYTWEQNEKGLLVKLNKLGL